MQKPIGGRSKRDSAEKGPVNFRRNWYRLKVRNLINYLQESGE